MAICTALHMDDVYPIGKMGAARDLPPTAFGSAFYRTQSINTGAQIKERTGLEKDSYYEKEPEYIVKDRETKAYLRPSIRKGRRFLRA